MALLDQIVQKQLRWSMCFCGLLGFFSQSCDSGVCIFVTSAWTNVFPISVGSAGMGEGFA